MKATAIHDRQAAASAIDPSLRHRRREHVLMMLLMSPAVLVVFALLVVPLSWLIVQSFYADGALSLAHYRRIFTEGIYWNTFI